MDRIEFIKASLKALHEAKYISDWGVYRDNGRKWVIPIHGTFSTREIECFISGAKAVIFNSIGSEGI